MKKTTLALLIGIASTVALAGQTIHVGQGKKDFPGTWTSQNPTDKNIVQIDNQYDTTTVYVSVAQASAILPASDGINLTCGTSATVHVAPGGVYKCVIGTTINPGTTVTWADDGSGKNPQGSYGSYNVQ